MNIFYFVTAAVCGLIIGIVIGVKAIMSSLPFRVGMSAINKYDRMKKERGNE